MSRYLEPSFKTFFLWNVKSPNNIVARSLLDLLEACSSFFLKKQKTKEMEHETNKRKWQEKKWFVLGRKGRQLLRAENSPISWVSGTGGEWLGLRLKKQLGRKLGKIFKRWCQDWDFGSRDSQSFVPLREVTRRNDDAKACCKGKTERQKVGGNKSN